MGRGRAKAKQTRIARDLKYSTHGTDLDHLAAELGGSTASIDDAVVATPLRTLTADERPRSVLDDLDLDAADDDEDDEDEDED